MRHREKASRERLLFYPNPLRLSLFIFQPVSSPFLSLSPPRPFPLPPCVSFTPSSSASLPRAPSPNPPDPLAEEHVRSPFAEAPQHPSFGRTLAAFPSMHHSDHATNEHGRRNVPAPSLAFFFFFFSRFSLTRGTICCGSKPERVASISAQMTTNCL